MGEVQKIKTYSHEELDLNVMQFDRDWDYTTQWKLIHEMRNQLNEVIKYMSELQEATPATNQRLCEEIEIVVSTGVTFMNLTDSYPSFSDIANK